MRGERLHHADLNGAKAATAGEHKGGFGLANLIEYRQYALPDRRVGNRPRGARRVIAAGEWGGLLGERNALSPRRPREGGDP